MAPAPPHKLRSLLNCVHFDVVVAFRIAHPPSCIFSTAAARCYVSALGIVEIITWKRSSSCRQWTRASTTECSLERGCLSLGDARQCSALLPLTSVRFKLHGYQGESLRTDPRTKVDRNDRSITIQEMAVLFDADDTESSPIPFRSDSVSSSSSRLTIVSIEIRSFLNVRQRFVVVQRVGG